MKPTRGQAMALSVIAFVVIAMGVFFFGRSLLFRLMDGPDILVSKEDAIKDYQARMELIDAYQSTLRDARQKRDVSICGELLTFSSFYSGSYIQSYSGGPLVPQREFAKPRLDCVRAYAVDFLDPDACDQQKTGLSEIGHERCLVDVAHEMRRKSIYDWKAVCDSLRSRDEQERCEQDVINPEKTNREEPQWEV